MAMQFEHEFTVPVPVDQAWPVLLDVERVAPCLPGAAVDSVEGNTFTGRMKVKVGPITVTYSGKASFEEVDKDAHKVTLKASGRETRGAGTANATVRARLLDEGGQTKVTVETSFNVTGRPAQFGRGVMAEVGGRLIDRFAENLAELLRGLHQVPAERLPELERALPEGEPVPVVVRGDDRHDRDEPLRPVTAHRELAHAQVGHAEHGDPAVAPRLPAQPGDGVEAVGGLVLEGAQLALGAAGAPAVLHQDVEAGVEEGQHGDGACHRLAVRVADEQGRARLAAGAVEDAAEPDPVPHRHFDTLEHGRVHSLRRSCHGRPSVPRAVVPRPSFGTLRTHTRSSVSFLRQVVRPGEAACGGPHTAV